MTTIIVAWLVGEGLMIYNDVAKQHRPPFPSDLLSTSGLFILLAIMAEKWPTLAATLAWGFDIAAFMVLFSNKEAAAKKAPAPAPAK